MPNGYPTVTQDPDHGVIRVIFSGSRSPGERILEFRSFYFPVIWEQPQTYPLQSTRQAWEQLLAGQGMFPQRRRPGGRTQRLPGVL